MNKEKLQARYGEIQTRREEIKALGDKATPDDVAEFSALVKEQETITATLNALSAGERIDATFTAAAPVPANVIVAGPVADSAKYSLGEYLQDIFKAGTGRSPGARFDNLQKKFQAAASGLNETIPNDGGYLVGTDMVTDLSARIYDEGQLARRCSRVGVSANSNSLTINGIDETSRADGSRYGGVRGYWEDEAGTIDASQPKFAPINLKLKKVTAAYYATDELLQDAPALTGFVNQAVGKELAFKLDDAIFRGTGAGKPQGILYSPALIEVSKQDGQKADTIVWENIRDMYARLRGKANGVWIANEEDLPQLMEMVKPVGTGGIAIWLPANPAANQPTDTLLGKPIIYPEQASALGDKGDICFVDFSQYQLIEKGGVQGASSIHVKFLQGEQVFRFVYRVDGQLMWKSALTPYKGAKTYSPAVTLAERA